MSARDDAIQTMDEVQSEQLEYPIMPYVLEMMLDAIPGDVLVRLAIERGALLFQGYKVIEGTHTPLYGLVKP